MALGSLPLRMLTQYRSAVHLVPQAKYEQALAHPKGALKDISTEECRDILNENIRQDRTASDTLSAPVTSTELLPIGGMVVVFFNLGSSEMEYEQERLRDTIDP